MTKELKTIDLNLLPIVTLGEMANEAAEQVEKNAKATVQKAIDCGRYLTAIKEQLEHGQWGGWLGANWNYSQSLAVRYMHISNSDCSVNLKSATSINDALRIIADSKPETVPRSERKPADVVVSIPAESREFQNEPDIDVPFSPPDDDPTPDPPTQRKTAKGTEKVSEEKKPRTQTVPVEIIDDEPKEILPEEKTLSDWCEHEILEYLVSTADDAKRRAKALRKAADKLDPPDESKAAKIPTINDLKAMIDAEELSDQMIAAVTDWVQYKQRHPDKKYRYQSGESFIRDQKRMVKVYMKTGEPFVLESIDTAISKGWRGWEQDNIFNGKVNGNGSANRGTTKRRPTVEDVFG